MSSVGVKTIRAVLGAASVAGLDPSVLARAHRLSLDDLQNPDFRMPYAAWTAMWDDVARDSGDPTIGLRAAEALGTAHWDVIDYVVASSDTLGDALRRFERYFGIISTGARHRLEVGRDEARIVREYAEGAQPHRIATEFAFANIVQRSRARTARHWSPSRVEFRHPKTTPSPRYARIFEAPIRFDADVDAIVIPREHLALPMAAAAPELCAVLERHAAYIIEKLPPVDASLVERARHAVTLELRGGAPELSTVAKRLGVSARTLQRRLAEDGVPFRDLVEKTREELARRYVEDRSIGLGEIAFLVGFSDASAFYKAFRRWTGRTPGELRNCA